jgi:hypothetical protein
VSGFRLNVGGYDIRGSGRSSSIYPCCVRAVRETVRENAFVETPYFNVKASEITLIISDT